MRLIPNNIDVSEQFKIRYRFIEMVSRWYDEVNHENSYLEDIAFINTTLLLKESGIRCHYVTGNLAGFFLEDEQQYIAFTLKYL